MIVPVNSEYSHYLADQRGFHDRVITEDWDAYISAEWDETRRYEISELFKIVRPRAVIDIGCGCGFHDVEIANYEFVERVDSIDPSPASIVKAEQFYHHKKVKRWVSRLNDLQCDRVYDFAFSVDVFEHLNEPMAYLAKMKQIVLPGGHAAIITPNRLRWSNMIRLLTGRSATLISVMHYREYSYKELCVMGQEQGLVPVGGFCYGLYCPITSFLTHSTRLRLGRALPRVANGMAVVFCVP
jgi:2-polyprenyl-3-methyl-5-hydroxy-6-metoxy-1,4-benzoquinol methylase